MSTTTLPYHRNQLYPVLISASNRDVSGHRPLSYQMFLSPSPNTRLPCKTPQVSAPFLPTGRPFLRTANSRAYLTTPFRAFACAPPATLPKSAIQRIAEKLRSLGYLEHTDDRAVRPPGDRNQPHSAGEIFIPTPKELPKHRVGHTLDSSWSTPEWPIPGPGTGNAILRFHELRKVVEGDKRNAPPAQEAPMLAELALPPNELRRLRGEGIKIKKSLKVGKAGITEGIVNGIHERWRRTELVKIKCEDICRMNMKRTHAILERKTGGLVVWRSGSIIILYRGDNYKYPYFTDSSFGENHSEPSAAALDNLTHIAQDVSSLSGPSGIGIYPSLIVGVGSPKKVRFQLPSESQLEEEADELLDGLGPRFTDWWGCEPVPVDADLLSPVVSGYRRPFRLLPFGISPKLTDREMTVLRRLSRPLPCHFALGRNRNLQGLAASMIKLWEKCEIAKIAVKRGVQNTNSELMSEELKRLTGGTLLSRDREFIVFYRGKDFLPPAVSNAIKERRNAGMYQKRMTMNENSFSSSAHDSEHGSGEESRLKKPSSLKLNLSTERREKPEKPAIKILDAKLSTAIEKKKKAEKLLEELQSSANLPKQVCDREAISEEERYMLRKVGLRMKSFLLLGRRGVFDGTVENMHLHWKYRELVKIISKHGSFEDVHEAARTLEVASGGILVAVERVNKGYAMIVYRGKNYKRPTSLRPQTLLSKKEALKRYLEGQRCESLKLHVLKLSRHIDTLKLESAAECRGLDIEHESQQNINELVLQTEVIDIDHEQDLLETTTQCSYTRPSSNASAAENEPENELSISMSSDSSIELSVEGSDEKLNSSPPNITNESEPVGSISFTKGPLSNRERLVLRKQALKMKKRPVLSVGRNNAIEGVAKTIRSHFKKYPLAIVNIKGIAKGTSVQEMVFELERATNSVLVSREPSKVILYRGWGAGVDCKCIGKQGEIKQTSIIVDEVSPELMSAIKIECGIQAIKEEEAI